MIGLTLIVRTLTFPLTRSQFKGMAKMRLHAPELKKLATLSRRRTRPTCSDATGSSPLGDDQDRLDRSPSDTSRQNMPRDFLSVDSISLCTARRAFSSSTSSTARFLWLESLKIT